MIPMPPKIQEALDIIYHELNQRHLDWYADNEIDNKVVDILRDTLNKNYLLIKQALMQKENQLKHIKKLFVYWQMGRLDHADFDKNMQETFNLNKEDIKKLECEYDLTKEEGNE